MAGARRIYPPKRVPQEIELPFRDLADSCLLLVDRELQLAHDLAQSLPGLLGLALPAQDHEIVGIGHDATAEASLQPELLPSQHEPTHVQIDRKSTRLNSSHQIISYAVFCLKKKKNT